MNKSVWKWLQVLITAAILIYVIRIADWKGIGAALREAHAGFIAAALACMGVSAYLQALRWRVVNPALGLHVSKFLYFIFVGFFFNFFLPGASTGEAVKVFLFGRKYGSLMHNTVLTAATKLIGLAFQFVLGGIAFFWMWEQLKPLFQQQIDWGDSWLPKVMGLVGLVMIAGVGYFVFRKYFPRLYAEIPKSLAVMKSGKPLYEVVAYTFGVQLLSYANAWFIYKSVGVTVPWPAIMLFQSVTTLALMLPITIGGLGVREVVTLGLYGHIGQVHHDAVLATIMIGYFSLALFAAVGGVWMLFRKWKKHGEDMVEPTTPLARDA